MNREKNNSVAITQKTAVFTLLWVGQFVSVIGSGLTTFALGVSIYQESASITGFTLFSFFEILPIILFSPIAGALVDRWNRRWAMILSDSGAAVCTFIIWILLLTLGNNIPVWQIYLLTALSSTFRAFQWPAYTATTTLLVPKEHYTRASGLVQLGEGAGRMLSPILAGLLFSVIGIERIILIDFATFFFALFTLFLVRVPTPKESLENKENQGNILKELKYAWRYLVERPGLFGLLIFLAIVNLTESVVTVLIVPLVLTFADVTLLGRVLTVASAGLVLGAVTLSVWGGPKRRVHGVLFYTLLRGVLLLIAIVELNATVIAIVAFGFMFCVEITMGCSQDIWQRKVAPDIQGRVFALRQAVAWSAIPLGYLIAGPLVENVFEPFLVNGGALSTTVGSIIGTEPGKGINLLFIMMGLFNTLVVIAAYSYKRIINVETELPDVVDDDPVNVSASGLSSTAGVA